VTGIFLGWDKYTPWVTFDPIVKYIERRWPADDYSDLAGPARWSNSMISQIVDYDQAAIQRWRLADRVSLWSADAICTKGLGRNPMEIYGFEWYDIPVDIPLCLPGSQRDNARRMFNTYGRSGRFEEILAEIDGHLPIRPLAC
jgi:hypothetical protein